MRIISRLPSHSFKRFADVNCISTEFTEPIDMLLESLLVFKVQRSAAYSLYCKNLDCKD